MKAFFTFFLSRKKEGGGDNRARTDDPLLAKQVLSQLSYTPMAHCFSLKKHSLRSGCAFRAGTSSPQMPPSALRGGLGLFSSAACDQMVGLDGLEPSTSRLSVVRSSQLSYRPI